VQEINARQGEEPDIGQFVHLGPLGTALLPYERPRVLLIDELDKSDIDLPNDLLNVFEDGYFEVLELQRLAARHPEVMTVLTADRDGSAVVRRGRVRCRVFPIVIVTSNGEREFPAPFLRRCLKLRVEPPTPQQLGAMVAAQFGETDGVDVSRLISEFLARSEETGGLASDQLLNAVHLAMELATSGAYQPDDDWQELLLLDGSCTGDVRMRAEGADGAVTGWRDQLDPTGQTLFLVLTDGIGDGWRTGAVTRALASWARHTPVALVNLPPQRLCHLTRLTPRHVSLRAAAPGVPNTRLRIRTESGLSIKDESAMPIPVLGLEPKRWSAWARLFAVPGPGWVKTTTVLVEPDAVENPMVGPDSDRQEIPLREQVLRFRIFASAPAFQFAGPLAAAPRSLPTINLAQRALPSSADVSALAEMVLGGLLRRTSFRPDDKDAVGDEFHKGVREELLSSGRRSDTIRVARLIDDHLGPRNPIVRNSRMRWQNLTTWQDRNCPRRSASACEYRRQSSGHCPESTIHMSTRLRARLHQDDLCQPSTGRTHCVATIRA
jgi:hypothetical protein